MTPLPPHVVSSGEPAACVATERLIVASASAAVLFVLFTEHAHLIENWTARNPDRPFGNANGCVTHQESSTHT